MLQEFRRRLGRFAALAATAVTISGLFFLGASSEAASSKARVYVLGNQPGGNAVLVFDRDAGGSLTAAGAVPTGGAGTGATLGSQGALSLSDNGRYLFAVNAGSHSISSFEVEPGGLRLVATVPSGGQTPISLTVSGELLYVLNGGGAGNISGFEVDNGSLAPIAGSTQPLSGAGVGPAQIQFSPDGRVLVVTEKNTNRIVTYRVGRDGVAGAPVIHPSNGAVPFGFDFAGRNTLIVSEAAPGALSSYDVSRSADVDLVDGTVANSQAAACWVVVTGNSRYAYTTNAASGTISGYRVNQAGDLTLLTAGGVTATTGPSPIDVTVSGNSRFLYALSNGGHVINGFRVEASGALTPIPGAPALPVGAIGIASQ